MSVKSTQWIILTYALIIQKESSLYPKDALDSSWWWLCNSSFKINLETFDTCGSVE